MIAVLATTGCKRPRHPAPAPAPEAPRSGATLDAARITGDTSLPMVDEPVFNGAVEWVPGGRPPPWILTVAVDGSVADRDARDIDRQVEQQGSKLAECFRFEGAARVTFEVRSSRPWAVEVEDVDGNDAARRGCIRDQVYHWEFELFGDGPGWGNSRPRNATLIIRARCELCP
jgi:hypothetical protein